MEQEVTFVARLRKEFPDLFEDCRGGVYIGKGWENIVEILCRRIENHIHAANKRSKFHNDPSLALGPIKVRQIKEKFGGLRFYCDGTDDYVDGMIAMTESWAEHTCEKCGQPGKLRDGSWIRTLCDSCEGERNA